MGIDPLSRPLSFAPLSPPPLSEARLARLARAREWRWQLGLACLASLLWTLALALLGCFHWISVEAESFETLKALNIQQSAGALEGLWIVYALVPVIGMIISTFFYLGYKLNDKDVQIMARCNAGEITREEAEALLSRKY